MKRKRRMSIVLGLDLSQTSTGWAVLDGAASPVFGHLEYPTWGNDEPKWLSEFHGWLRNTIIAHKVSHVFYEETFLPMPRQVMGKRGKPIFKPAESFDTRFAQMALVAVTQVVAHEEGCEIRVVRIRDWRERFIGATKAPPSFGAGDANRRWLKQQAVTAANLMGWFTADHNEAEALGIAHFGMCCVNPRYTENTNVHTTRMQQRFAELMRGER